MNKLFLTSLSLIFSLPLIVNAQITYDGKTEFNIGDSSTFWGSATSDHFPNAQSSPVHEIFDFSMVEFDTASSNLATFKRVETNENSPKDANFVLEIDNNFDNMFIEAHYHKNDSLLYLSKEWDYRKGDSLTLTSAINFHTPVRYFTYPSVFGKERVTKDSLHVYDPKYDKNNPVTEDSLIINATIKRKWDAFGTMKTKNGNFEIIRVREIRDLKIYIASFDTSGNVLTKTLLGNNTITVNYYHTANDFLFVAQTFYDINNNLISGLVTTMEGAPINTYAHYLQQLNVSIYPNPASSHINIQGNTDDVFTYEIIDFTGKTIEKSHLHSSKSIDVTTLLSGPYVLKLKDKNGSPLNAKVFVKN